MSPWQEWDVANLEKVIDWIPAAVSSRKRRLAVCAVCRLVPGLMDDSRAARAIRTAEAFADGLVSARRVRKEFRAVHEGLRAPEQWTTRDMIFIAGEANPSLSELSYVMDEVEEDVPALKDTRDYVAAIRDVIPNPFLLLSPGRTSPEIMNLATVINEQRDWDGLPVLADALEDAGGWDQLILAHLRLGLRTPTAIAVGSGAPVVMLPSGVYTDRWPWQHFRGCWALDLVLGRL